MAKKTLTKTEQLQVAVAVHVCRDLLNFVNDKSLHAFATILLPLVFPSSRWRKINNENWLHDSCKIVEDKLEQVSLVDVFRKAFPVSENQNIVYCTANALRKHIESLSAKVGAPFSSSLLFGIDLVSTPLYGALQCAMQSINIVGNGSTANKQKILLIGLLPGQHEVLSREYSEYFDLRVWTSDDTIAKLKVMLNNCDKAFVLKNFTKHQSDDVLRTQRNTPFVRLRGGLTALRAALSSL